MKLFDDNNPTIIGNDVWLGANVVVKQGVKIGDGAVIGANAVITHDVPPYSIVVGVPAKIIKFRFNEKQISLLLNSKWFAYEPKKAKKIIQELYLTIFQEDE